jgi:branched-subunit amino acid transport protein
MTWPLLLALGGGAYALKALGLVVLGGRTLPPALSRCVALLPAALLAGLIVMQTFTDGQELVLDARAAGVGAAAVAVWRRAPFPVVVVVGAAVAAGLRALA